MAHAVDGKPIFSCFGYRNAHTDQNPKTAAAEVRPRALLWA